MIAKIAGAILVPPGIIFLLLLLSLILLIAHRRRSGLFGMTLSLLLLYLLSIDPFVNLILSPLENSIEPITVPQASNIGEAVPAGGKQGKSGTPPGPETPGPEPPGPEKPGGAEYIIVLGAGTAPAVPPGSSSRAYRPSPHFLARLAHGVELYRMYGLPIVVSGGVVFSRDGMEAEAEHAREALLHMGVPDESIILERRSRNTWQNAEYSAEIVGNSPVILVTSALHMRRALFSFQNHGVEASPSPSGYMYEPEPFNAVDYLPGAEALRGASAALHEYIGLVYYFLKSLIH